MTVQLLGPAQVRDLAELVGLRPTKKLGQNFVIDANTVRRIVRTAEIAAGETVLEVGPGLGSLTLGLLEAGASVLAVEVDDRLAAQLPLTVAELAPGADLRVLHADALRVGARESGPQGRGAQGAGSPELAALPTDPAVLVANLPYNVSVPVILHLLSTLPSLQRGLVMVQAEVGERLAAPPGSRTYGSPSAKAAWFGRFTLAGRVSRQVFWPVPNVDSVLVRFVCHPQPGPPAERDATFAVVDAAFGQRRKMLRQALAVRFGERTGDILSAAGIAGTARGEQLSIADFQSIARAAARLGA